MDNNHQTEALEYNYLAKQVDEAKAIREKYLPKEQNAIEQLKQLDQSITKKGVTLALAIGIVSALILGTGMSMIMQSFLFVPGILVGIIGLIGCGAAYPIYKNRIEKEKKRLAPEIIELSEQIINGKKNSSHL